MAEKIACGYFLLLRNKKQLISMASFLAAARQPKRMAEKIACGYFLLYPGRVQKSTKTRAGTDVRCGPGGRLPRFFPRPLRRTKKLPAQAR